MLPTSNRLVKKKDFDQIHKKGRFVGENFLAIKFLKNNLTVSRFGFLVGTKISKKAVQRNLIKRRLRESVRLKLDAINSGYDIVFFTKPEIEGKSYEEINKAVENILEKGNLLHTNS